MNYVTSQTFYVTFAASKRLNLASQNQKFMKETNDDPNYTVKYTIKKDDAQSEGYPLYPAKEDVYNQNEKVENIDPDNIQQRKSSGENGDGENDLDDNPGADLDVPGSELDDAEERIGSEDEENNYYSIGGDNHDDLEEDKS